MKYVNKFLIILKSFIFSFYFTILSLFSSRVGVSSSSNYVVSLTTYRKRLPFVYLTIESLLRQKSKPKRIILVLSYEDCSPENLPFLLCRQKTRGLEVKFVSGNYKSYKKLSYAFEYGGLSHGMYVVTADDDVFYPDYWLEVFKKYSKTFPDRVLCFRGRVINFTSLIEVEDYGLWKLASVKDVRHNNLIPTGVSGVCYPYWALLLNSMRRHGSPMLFSS
ncbi:glycosyltransferase [Vibrio fluvialis]|nr:glycosyltransferase [Vibrio fluvialis]